MYNQSQPLHIGSLIYTTLKQKGHSVTWLASQLHCDRSNLYKIFDKYYIDTDLLYRISKILNTDFFQYYSQKLLEK